jgi:hypothetical protein
MTRRITAITAVAAAIMTTATPGGPPRASRHRRGAFRHEDPARWRGAVRQITRQSGAHHRHRRRTLRPDQANVLISDRALPAGAHMQTILMIKSVPDAKAVTERFVPHLH